MAIVNKSSFNCTYKNTSYEFTASHGANRKTNQSIFVLFLLFRFLITLQKLKRKYRGLDPSRNYNADTLSPDQMIGGGGGGPQQTAQQSQSLGGTQRMTSATPTMQQRIKALGVATPLALSSPVRR